MDAHTECPGIADWVPPEIPAWFDVPPEGLEEPPKPDVPRTWHGAPLVHSWAYRDAAGEIIGHVGRYGLNGRKECVPFFGAGGKPGAAPEPRPLFGLERLAANPAGKAVVICEGEKCAAALQSLGVCAVTSPGGSKAASKADWKPLNGARKAYLLPDNDSPGQSYVRDVCACLRALESPPAVFIVELPGLPEAGDVVDWLQARCPGWDGFEPLPESEQERLFQEFREALREHAEPVAEPVNPIRAAAAPFTLAELESAQLSPRCIVRDYLYCDLGALVAEGGAGKTTATLYEAVCIVLGRPVWGLEVCNPGRVLFVTAEDSRERFAARLHRMMTAMDLTPNERARVIAGVHVWDVVGESRKLVKGGLSGIEPTDLADQIVEAFRDDPPVLIVVDPLVSFGASEQAVNDNEQGLVTAGRRIVRGLGCCVRYVHHVGKGNARAATTDQYSGRGGSALPDGCRMVSTMVREENPKLPWGTIRNPTASYTRLCRPKVSYAPPGLPDIFIEREGWTFRHYVDLSPAAGVVLNAHTDQLERFLSEQLKAGRYHTKATLEQMHDDLGMSRGELRKALTELTVSGRVSDASLPKSERHGQRKTYLHPSSIPPHPLAGLDPEAREQDDTPGTNPPRLNNSPLIGNGGMAG